MRRAYDQYCPIAHALDLVGERWSLLVVRELMRGPKRYTDLAETLGIGTNILAARLKDLEAGGSLHEYYHPDSGEPIMTKGFQNWNFLVLNMIAHLDGRPMVTEF